MPKSVQMQDEFQLWGLQSKQVYVATREKFKINTFGIIDSTASGQNFKISTYKCIHIYKHLYNYTQI